MGRPTKYPPEFRAEAVELVRRSDRSLVEVARDLGISDSTLSNWVRADRDARARASDPEGLSESERGELRRRPRPSRRRASHAAARSHRWDQDEAVQGHAHVEDHASHVPLVLSSSRRLT